LITSVEKIFEAAAATHAECAEHTSGDNLVDNA